LYLDWEKQAQDYYVIDIEADDLDATQVWVLCWENVKTKEQGYATDYESIRKFFDTTKGAYYVGHNVIKYDIPTLNRLVGTKVPLSQLIDTLVLSTLYNPSLDGGHSLGAWGERLGVPKIDFSDWTRYTPEMLTYCQQDVRLTTEFYRRLSKVLLKIGFSEKTCDIQHKITYIIERQRKNGFYFDQLKALKLYALLRECEQELTHEIQTVFPPRKVLVRTGSCFTRTGQPTAIYTKDRARFDIEHLPNCEYRAFRNDPFNIGSSKQRAERLGELGWVADEFTPTGQPKVTEKSLVKFADENDIPEVALITKWMSVNGRANMVNTWLEAFNENTNCIHGSLFVADTLRFRHQKPNTANIPAVRVKEHKDENGKVVKKEVLYGEAGYYTYEARDCWSARPGRVLVGTDAAGLELRMLAHYLNREGFTHQVINGDPHQYNADLAGVSRSRAKTLLYAIQYGAQAGKVAQIIEGTKAEGAAMRQQFLDRLGISGVMEDAISEQRNGRVWLVDGAGVVCPSPHAALNYKLQGGGARVMAQGAIFLEQYIRRHGLDSLKVGDIHDEWQYDVAPSDAREHARLSVQAIRDAGEELNLNLPLDGEAKVGNTWAETH